MQLNSQMAFCSLRWVTAAVSAPSNNSMNNPMILQALFCIQNICHCLHIAMQMLFLAFRAMFVALFTFPR